MTTDPVSDRPAYAPTFTIEHGPQPGEVNTGWLDESERLQSAPPPHEPSSPHYQERIPGPHLPPG